jgi:hypothetical protein
MNDTLLLSIFVAVEGAHAFSAFMPSYFTVKKFAAGQRDAARLRSGYVPAVAFNLVLGGVVSAIAKDKRPVIFAAIVCLAMIALYERAIRQ